MINLRSAYFEVHLIITIMLTCAYIVYMLINKDELEEKAQNYALKCSNLLTIVPLIFYVLYKSVTGNIKFTPHIVLIIINAFCVLYLLFYFLYLKSIRISFKIKNTKFIDIICYLSSVVSIILIITQALKVKFFEITSSFIRLDSLLMLINIIVISLVISIYPSKKITRQEYREREIASKKFSKIFVIVYGIFILWIIGYVVYKFSIK